jgi:recombinational DNA repair protein RecT
LRPTSFARATASATFLATTRTLEHEPDLDNVDEPGALRFAYAIAWLKNGTVIREVMTRSQVAQVRNVSKSKDSPSRTVGAMGR